MELCTIELIFSRISCASNTDQEVAVVLAWVMVRCRILGRARSRGILIGARCQRRIEAVVGEAMLARVVAHEAQVQAARVHELVVDDDALLVVAPQQRRDGRMAQHVDVGAERLEALLALAAAELDADLRLAPHEQIDHDALLGAIGENVAELPLVGRRSLEEGVGRDPPAGDEDAVLGLEQAVGEVGVVLVAAQQPLDRVAVAARRERMEAMALGVRNVGAQRIDPTRLLERGRRNEATPPAISQQRKIESLALV